MEHFIKGGGDGRCGNGRRVNTRFPQDGQQLRIRIIGGNIEEIRPL